MELLSASSETGQDAKGPCLLVLTQHKSPEASPEALPGTRGASKGVSGSSEQQEAVGGAQGSQQSSLQDATTGLQGRLRMSLMGHSER